MSFLNNLWTLFCFFDYLIMTVIAGKYCCPVSSVYITWQLWPVITSLSHWCYSMCLLKPSIYSMSEFIAMCLHVLFFSHSCDLLSLNQDMLRAAAAAAADDSVMWECHQSLGTVTGFCLSASDAQTVAISAHFTIAAVSPLFYWVISSVSHPDEIQIWFNTLSFTLSCILYSLYSSSTEGVGNSPEDFW